MGLNRYQLTFESYGNHYQIYGRNIQDVMGGVTGGAGVYGYAYKNWWNWKDLIWQDILWYHLDLIKMSARGY